MIVHRHGLLILFLILIGCTAVLFKSSLLARSLQTLQIVQIINDVKIIVCIFEALIFDEVVVLDGFAGIAISQLGSCYDVADRHRFADDRCSPPLRQVEDRRAIAVIHLYDLLELLIHFTQSFAVAYRVIRLRRRYLTFLLRALLQRAQRSINLQRISLI